jgi:23S rRNA pseudouridine1911/1915/1917 synthase
VLLVEEKHGGARLDRFLVDTVPELSRARVKAMIEDGHVRLNGHRARKGDAVTAGQTVELLAPPPPRDFDPIAQPEGTIKYKVLYQDADVIVVDKPTGVPTHPLEPTETGTLVNVLVSQFPEILGVGFARKEAGLLHRLDTDTSGVVVIARKQSAFDSLRAASKEHKLHKRYVALVEGAVPAAGRVDYPLVPHRKDPRRVEAVTPHVRLRAGTRTFDALTFYTPTKEFHTPEGTFTLIEVQLENAFRHQIRVHLASVGHPLVGDVLYKGPNAPLGIELPRHFLHAHQVVFESPTDGHEIKVTAPLPNDLSAALARLESAR